MGRDWLGNQPKVCQTMLGWVDTRQGKKKTGIREGLMTGPQQVTGSHLERPQPPPPRVGKIVQSFPVCNLHQFGLPFPQIKGT